MAKCMAVHTACIYHNSSYILRGGPPRSGPPHSSLPLGGLPRGALESGNTESEI